MRKGLIGEKLGHSFSKVIHEQILDDIYELIPLNEAEFHQFMTDKPFDAINVTIPYKEKVIPYCHHIDDKATSIHAINAIKNINGTLYATNTDFEGLKLMIEHHGFDLKDHVVALLGTGGTSKTALAVCKSLGVREVIQVGRNKPEPIISYEKLKEHKEIEYIINTTSVGMYPNNYNQLIDLTDFPNCKGVIDVIYNPLMTSLTLQAHQLNIPAVNGLEMLVGQAVVACEFFHDIHLDHSIITTITKQLQKDMTNIVLIGMPSCGKTTISRLLGKAMNREVIDLDEVIVSRYGSIPEIFKNHGEEKFREIETEICLEMAKSTGKIISCGGGIIKNEWNMDALKMNGCIVYIQRSLDHLIVDDSRPLSSSIDNLKKMEIERKPLYEKYCDFSVLNESSLEEVIEDIKERYDETFDYKWS